MFEDDLAGEIYFFGEQDLSDSMPEPIGVFLRQYRINGALSVSADFAEECSDREHEWCCKSCGVVELTGHGQNVLLGDWYSVVLEKPGIQVASRRDPSVFLVKIESEFEHEAVLEAVPGHPQVFADTFLS